MPKAILIMTDSQRYDMVGCNRETGLRTPHLDRLAREGTRFTRAYTTQPVCQPARAGIFTGMYPHASGSWTNSVGIADNVHSIGERMRDQGIHTAYIGKWHLDGGDYFGLGRCPDGWDPAYWYDMRNYLEELTPEERLLSRESRQMEVRDFSSSFTFAHRCTDRAVRFLEKEGGDDFFLTVSYDEPHGPFICPPEYAHMYDDFDFPKSDNVYDTLEGKPDVQKVWAGDAVHRDRESLRLRAAYFFGCNSYVDAQIGRVLAAAARYAPDALIIYTSDHGDMLQSHCLEGKGPAAYDEIARVPLFIRGPGLPAGAADDRPASHIHLAPTLFEWFGLPHADVFSGRSMLTQLKGGEPAGQYVFIEFGRYEVDHDGFGGLQLLRAVFDGRYKLCINLLSTDELYDLETDPGEMINLILSPELSDIRDRLHDVLLDNMNVTRDPFRGYYWERRVWRSDAGAATWAYTGMTRQREDGAYEPRQLDYATGLPITQTTRMK